MNPMHAESPHSPQQQDQATLGLRLAALWAALSTTALIALYIRHRHASLDGDFQGWASASCMLMARAFNELGAFHTHFVPLQNNLPQGSDPDVYLHWPPFYPFVLSIFLRLLGDSVTSGRILSLLITLACGALVMLIARHLYTPRIAWLAVFFFFTARATSEGAAPLLQQPLAILFALCAIFCFLRAVPQNPESPTPKHAALFALAGVASIALMVLSAWDPIFIPFGLLASALWLRQRRAVRLGIAYCAAAVLTFAGIEADYVLSFPRLFANQFATIAYRAGLHFNADSSVRLHTIVDAADFQEQYSLIAAYWRALRMVDVYFSSITLLFCITFIALWLRDGARRNTAATWLIGGLFLPVVVWYAIMRNYVAIHPFPLFLAAPFIAISSGFLLDSLWAKFSQPQDKYLRWVLVFALPLLILHPLLVQYRDAEITQPPEFANLAQLIATNTPPTAVVLTPTESLVPTYYSHRHLVRGIESGYWLTQATAEAHHDFPNAPLFFALRDVDAHDLPQTLAALLKVGRLGDSTLYTLP